MRVKGAWMLLVAATASTWADEPPPAEFWLYLLEYGNAQAEVLDPLEYEQIARAAAQKDADDARSEGQEENSP